MNGASQLHPNQGTDAGNTNIILPKYKELLAP